MLSLLNSFVIIFFVNSFCTLCVQSSPVQFKIITFFNIGCFSKVHTPQKFLLPQKIFTYQKVEVD